VTRPGVPLDPSALMARLAARGSPVDSALAALDALEASWGEDPELEAAVAAWLGAATDTAAGPRLHALEARTTDKAVRKEIKRALHRLVGRGLWSRPAAEAPPSARELLGSSEAEPEAWLTEVDPSGTQLLWMARRIGDGVGSLSAVVNDTTGLIEVHAGETTRKALRQAHRDLASRSGLSLVEAPWPYADALLETAWERTSDRTRFSDLPRARRLIAGELAPGPGAPPVDALLDRASVAADGEALAASAEMLRAGKVTGWLLPPDWLGPAIDALEEARSSLVVVSPAQQEERARAATEKALEEIFAIPERRALFARRFETSAYVRAKRGDAPTARAMLAAALATAAGRPLAEIPALAELARLSLGLALEGRAEAAREQAKSSLVVTPAQALAEQRARSRRR
jgi:hypothetical protein